MTGIREILPQVRRVILNFVKRLSILVIALLVGAAAPARAWCEAACLAGAHPQSAKPHCPSHEQVPNGPSLSANDIAACPSIESARPVLAKLPFADAISSERRGTLAPSHLRTLAPPHLRAAAPLHLFSIPLRL